MAPFKVLYVQSHRTPLSSSQKKPEKSKIIRPDLVVETEEKVKVIQEKSQAAQYLIRKESPYNSKLIIMSTFGITSQGYTHFPHLAYLSESRDKILFKGGRL